MKGSNAISATAKPKPPRRADRPSPSQPSPIVDGFALAGPSNLPDPAFHAYRPDLADTALAGRVIASHYAEPLLRPVRSDTQVMAAPDEAAEAIANLSKGENFAMLDCTRGWAWGYAANGRVGFIPAAAVGA